MENNNKEQKVSFIPRARKWLYRLFGITERTEEEEIEREKELMQIPGKDKTGEGKDKKKKTKDNNEGR